MNYTPLHTRSKSYAYEGNTLPPPPTDADTFPVDYHIPPSPLYRRHNRKKSSQILIEPIGAPKTNYMPISPTITVPPALQTMFDGSDEKRNLSRGYQYPPRYSSSLNSPSSSNGREAGLYDFPSDFPSEASSLKRNLSNATCSTNSSSPLTPNSLNSSGGHVYIHRRSHTVSSRSHVPFAEEKQEFFSRDLRDTNSGLLDRRQSSKHERSSSDRTHYIPNHVRDSSTRKLLSIETNKNELSSPCEDRSFAPSPVIIRKIAYADKGLEILTANSFNVNALASGATYLIAGQFFSKLLVFLLNQLILKFVGPKTFGINAQLELFIITILYFSREAIRLASQRQSLVGKQPDLYRFEGGVVENTLSGTVQLVVNNGFVPIVIGLPLASILSCLYVNFSGIGSQTDYKSFSLAVIIVAVSAVVELMAEPSFLLFQLQLQLKKRATFESIAILSRCVITVLFILLGRKRDTGIIAFALGQFAYSSTLTTLYIFHGLKNARMKPYQLTYPRGVWTEGDSSTKIYFAPETKTLAASIWLHTLFKHCLTKGDQFLISLLLPIADQGVYAVVLNYGSLVARLVFLPIEEALRNFFSKLLATPAERKSMELSVSVLSIILRLYIYLSIFAVAFGPMVSSYVLQFLVSKAWLDTEAPVVLATYTCYIPFLAINGALESFVQSVATPADIKKQSSALFAFSLTFASAAYFLMRPFELGSKGLVLANMFNMAQRIGWCIMWIEEYYSRLRDSNSEPTESLEIVQDVINQPHNKGEISSNDENESPKLKPAKPPVTPRVYFDKPWGWIALAVPRPLVFGAVAGLAPTIWFLGTVSTFKGLAQHMCLAGLLFICICISELSLIKMVHAKVLNSKNKKKRAQVPVTIANKVK